MAGRGRMSNGFNSYDYKERDDLDCSELSNSHDSGPGSYNRHNQRRDGNPTLHVTNIPPGLDEKGLSNIFAAECCVPERVFISKNKKNQLANTYWGFVEYKNVAEAQSAIAAVNKKPPYELSVQFSKSFLDGNKDKLPGERPSQGFMGPGIRGRGHFYTKEPSHNSLRGSHSNDDFFPEDLSEDNSPKKFSSHGSPAEQNKSNSRERLPGLPIEKYSHVEISDEMDLHVAAYVSNRAKDLTLDDLSALCSEIKLALPFKPGQCSYCLRTAIYTCSRCKTWYCSDFCRTTHWPQHKDNCSPHSVVFEKDGTLSYKDIPDAFCIEDSSIQKCFGARSPRGTQGKKYGPDYRNDYFDNSDNYTGSERNIEKVNEKCRDNFDSTNKSPDNNKSGGGRDNAKDERGGRGGQKNSRRGGDRQSGGKQGARPDRKPASNWNIGSSCSSQSFHGDQTKSQASKSRDLDKAPISANLFTKVTVGAVSSEGEFWAYKVEDYKKQATMIKKLNEFAAVCGPDDIRIEMGANCIASYEGDWYRAEIIKVFRENVRVVFIDFGNESEVKKSDLKLLPENLSSDPPMAHKYVLAGSADNPKLHEEFTFSIKPVMQDKQGRWIVHAEGVPYQDLNGLGCV